MYPHRVEIAIASSSQACCRTDGGSARYLRSEYAASVERAKLDIIAQQVLARADVSSA